MPTSLARIVAGFLAGALAVAIFHQGAYLVLKQLGFPLTASPWNLAPNRDAFGLPTVANLMFWGGLWGILYALAYERLPGRAGWLKGFLFGSLFTMLLGSWLIVSLIKGRPILAGLLTDWNFRRLQTGFLLNGVAFGIGLGLLTPPLMRVLGVRPDPG